MGCRLGVRVWGSGGSEGVDRGGGGVRKRRG